MIRRKRVMQNILPVKLKEGGNEKLGEKILNVLKNIKGMPVYQDKLFTAPVDNETRLNIANILTPVIST